MAFPASAVLGRMWRDHCGCLNPDHGNIKSFYFHFFVVVVVVVVIARGKRVSTGAAPVCSFPRGSLVALLFGSIAWPIQNADIKVPLLGVVCLISMIVFLCSLFSPFLPLTASRVLSL